MTGYASLKRYVFLTALLAAAVAAPAAAASGDPAALFRQANELYSRGSYAGAVPLYEAVIASGRGNAAVHYNLGNALYRDHRMGQAVLAWERAHRLAPGDRAVRGNLALARARLNLPQPAGEALLDTLDCLLPGTAAALAGSATLFAAALLIALSYLRNDRRLRTAGTVCAAAACLIAGWLALKIRRETAPEAIVTAGPAALRDAPADTATPGATLAEGRKLRLLGEDGNWYAVELPAEHRRGWIAKDRLGRI